jgi:hypothetical protein
LVATDRVQEIFEDSRVLYDDAMEMLSQGKLRNAAEKAWGATKRATDAFLLVRTGEEPRTTAATTQELDRLANRDPQVKSLVGRYFSRIGQLHGLCFYDSICDPELTNRRVRETIAYIEDAEVMAGIR